MLICNAIILKRFKDSPLLNAYRDISKPAAITGARETDRQRERQRERERERERERSAHGRMKLAPEKNDHRRERPSPARWIHRREADRREELAGEKNRKHQTRTV